jgi:hypothetical protein
MLGASPYKITQDGLIGQYYDEGMAAGVAEVGGAEPLIDGDVVVVPEGPALLDSLLDDCDIIESSSDIDDVDEAPYSLLYNEQLYR